MSAVVADVQGSAPEVGGPCRPGTKGCICGTLSALYERGELVLRAGRVHRRALARKLGATRRWADSPSRAGRRSKAPARCIAHFDRQLKEGCICGTLSALHERGELVLRAGKVERRALARKLGVTRSLLDSPSPGTALKAACPVHRAFRPAAEGARLREAVGRGPPGAPRVPGAVQGIRHLADDHTWEVEPQCGAARVRT